MEDTRVVSSIKNYFDINFKSLFSLKGVVWRINVFRNKLVCAVGSRNGVEDTKLILYDFEWPIDQY